MAGITGATWRRAGGRPLPTAVRSATGLQPWQGTARPKEAPPPDSGHRWPGDGPTQPQGSTVGTVRKAGPPLFPAPQAAQVPKCSPTGASEVCASATTCRRSHRDPYPQAVLEDFRVVAVLENDLASSAALGHSQTDVK